MLKDIIPKIKLTSGKKTILTGETKIVDSISLLSSLSNLWMLSIFCEDRAEQSTLSGIKTEADVEHIHYAISGDQIAYILDVYIDDGEMKLSIENNELDSIVVKFNRIKN